MSVALLVIGLLVLVPSSLCTLFVGGSMFLGVGSADRNSRELAWALGLLFVIPGSLVMALGAWLTYSAFPRPPRAAPLTTHSVVLASPNRASRGGPRWTVFSMGLFVIGVIGLLGCAILFYGTLASGRDRLPLGQTDMVLLAATGAALVWAGLKTRRRD